MGTRRYFQEVQNLTNTLIRKITNLLVESEQFRNYEGVIPFHELCNHPAI
jgi:hypothetical protein